MLRVSKFLIFAVALAALACSGGLKPVDIEEGDMCSLCRMAISEKQFAAEIVTDDAVMKFDDIGCMLRYRKEKGVNAKSAVYVADSQTKSWLKAEDAFFTKSSMKTPMGSGIVAFASADKAGNGAVRFAQLEGQ